ncbi:HK97 gp10 family phage protein [Sphingomonas sp. PP-CE-1G-424]|uniref:HK97 gp10 family phage protein n=1 Tax=Sphingomonas sp. PP-CE-1G-424 TaxID=2135658 RepID=UPI001055110F|nr:HK97 gp10 family phage protein [Sphingomonas sp. PP-CE-1G-424]TCP64145.1 bacteriophage HK97-gp10 putative tail-component [Sphingomonas sp. PP-CE-1G-424]
MATSRGGAEVRRFIKRLPGELEKKVLRGAARAGGKIILAEAKERSVSSDVDDALVMRSKAEAGRITVKITVRKGWGRAIANWLEYGTDAHFITIAKEERGGKSVSRINASDKRTMIIGGKFVGETVWHPGAKPHPFLRPSLDIKGADAIAAAQSYINAHVTPSGIVASAEPEGDDA